MTTTDQLDLFAMWEGVTADEITIPEKPAATPGAFEFDLAIRKGLNRAIKASPFSRGQIAEQLTSLTGKDITENMLNTYTGKGRPNQLPANLLPALTMVLGPGLMDEIAQAAGCKLVEGNDLKLARLGQLYLVTVMADRETKRLISETPLFKGAAQ
ncbi:MAG: hypothetical protein CMM61_15645 [Rhodospirillaceae bacterium]|nr:hypothetical protein [Rhodospirillaceae bacterium]